MACAFCELRVVEPRDDCPLCESETDVRLGLCPEEIDGGSANPDAWLVDPWSRCFGVAGYTILGRSADISIRRARISRKHAAVVAQNGGWQVLDLNSANGTFVNDERVRGSHALKHGDIVRLESVCLLFAEQLNGERVSDALIPDRVATELAPDGPIPMPAPERRAPAEMIRLVEAPSGEGGLMFFNDRELRLTLLQFELVRSLDERRREESDEPQAVRGWVRSIELVTRLPWGTPRADDINLRHLVTRVRKRLKPLGLQIEAAHGLGYRLRGGD